MDKGNLLKLLSQASAEEVGGAFRDWARMQMREVIVNVFMDEVTRICGPAYAPLPGAACRRAGSAPGRIVVGGIAEAVVRPRMRKKTAAGGEVEVVPVSYRAAQDTRAVAAALVRAMAAGVSTREAGRIFPGAPASSASVVSRLWAEEGRKLFAAFRDRDISGERWFGLLMDGVHLTGDLMAVVVVGLTVDGRKVVLDFELGAAESFEVCDALLVRLLERGMSFAGSPLAIIDGSKQMARALRLRLKDVQIQRCLVHKERNLRRCLSRRCYDELSRLFNLLRDAEGEDTARERLADIRRFAAKHSYKAVESLDEAGDDLITLHRLHPPSTLNVSLLSTNGIENIFKTTRLKLGRVTRWRAATDQPQRWLAYALGEAEKGFRRINGWRDIPELLVCLGWPQDAVAEARRRQLEAIAQPSVKTRRGGRARTCVTPTHVHPIEHQTPEHQKQENTLNH